MHRAEKSSSRICRNREVERAQELHRKKIDDVKSYLTAATSPTARVTNTRPTAMKSSISSVFRKFKTPVTASTSHSSLCSGNGSSFCNTAIPDDDDDDDGDDDGTEQQHGGASFFAVHSGGCDAMYNESNSMAAHSLAKMDEFRSVAPVPMHSNTKTHHQHQYGKVPPPPVRPQKKTLNGSFRTRRLKEIQTNNVVIFERIKKSTAHYRNDDLKREWEQNVSYLASICEFPVAPVLLGNSAFRGNVLPASSSGIARTLPAKLHEQLPSIHHPAVVHPIRAIPTSPRKLQLNLSPAFRSLRKGMSQQPALPPITAASTGNAGSCSSSNFGCASPLSSSCIEHGGGVATSSVASTAGCTFHSNSDDDDGERHLMNSEVPSLPSRATSIGSPFVGDLSSPSRITSFADPNFPAPSPSSCSLDVEKQKYQLLKLGRFVGGAYLVLTVFCGDGVTNPYGFDVFAFDRESACEFQLRVTKAMTHELLDTISSSSQAAVTAAAAGTNLSMEEIAKSICDHVSFTRFESGMGEMAFLMARGVSDGANSSSDEKSKAALLVGSASSAIAFCIHQVVEIGCGAVDDEETESDAEDECANNADEGGSSHKRRLHVFASMRPQKSTPFAYDEALGSHSSGGNESNLTIGFQMGDNVQSHAAATSSSKFDLEADISVDELCEIVSKQSGGKPHSKHRAGGMRASAYLLKEHMSLERVVVAAIRHLHIVSVPSGKESEGDESEVSLKQVLIVNQHINTLLNPVASVASSNGTITATLEKRKNSRSRHRLPRASSPARGHPSSSHPALLDGSGILESGVIWKNAYVLARVSIIMGEKGGDGSAIRKMPQYIQELDASLHFSVYNPLSTSYSECTFSPEQIECLVKKLSKLVLDNGDHEDFQESAAFIKHVLMRLQIEVDLFGVEVLTFPSLDVKQPMNSHTLELLHHSGSSTFCFSRSSLHGTTAMTMTGTDKRSPGRQGIGLQKDKAATIIQAQVRGYLFRKQYYYEEEDDDDGDENEDDDDEEHEESDEQGGEMDLHTEMQFQSGGECSRQQSRQSGGGASGAATTDIGRIGADGDGEPNEIAKSATTEEPHDEAEADPEVHESASSAAPTEATAISLRRGVKANNRYCLVKLQSLKFAGDGDAESKQIVFRLGELGHLALQQVE